MPVTSRPAAWKNRPPAESASSSGVSELTYDQRASAATEAVRLVVSTLESESHR